jgi:flagellar hook-associated protein 3 FlgL
VTNPATWNALTDKNYQVKFWVDNTTSPGFPTTYYDIIDTTNNVSMITGGAPASPPTFSGSGLRQYHEGQPILLSTQTGDAGPAFDLGSQVLITGDPADSDSFDLAPSASHSMFKTIASLISAVENGQTGTAAGSAALSNNIGFALTELDQASDSLLRVRAAIGSRMSEVESLSNMAEDLVLQHKQTLSKLQDLDYAATISDLARKQTDLEAAQKSFMSISKLSLFEYI